MMSSLWFTKGMVAILSASAARVSDERATVAPRGWLG